MDFKSLFKKSKDDVLLVGAEGEQSVTKKSYAFSTIFFYASLLFLLGALFLGFSFTGDLLSSRENFLQTIAKTIEQKSTEQKNLEALKTLLEQVDTIQEDQGLVEQAIPEVPHEDQVIKALESILKRLQSKFLVVIPENISWKTVSPNDVTNEDFEALQVMEYTLTFQGEYQGFLDFIKTMRSHLRLFDIRALRNIQLQKTGLVSADVTFWTYNLAPL